MTTSYIKKGVINALNKGAWENVGGIPLVARNLYFFSRSGLKEIVILIPEELNEFPDLSKWKGNANLSPVTVRDLLDYLSSLKEDFFYLDSSFLFDERIIKKILSSSPITIFLKDESDKRITLGSLNTDAINVWKEEGPSKLLKKANLIFLKDIETFSEEIRGEVEPYVAEVREKKDADYATQILIENMQKKVMDLPAEYIDPFFENRLTKLLCNTPITPNMVTIFSLFVALFIAFLFYKGYFVIGAFCTYIVDVLDGVDGKLARTRLEFSKFGEYECLIDYFYENLWYLSIGVGLKRTFQYEPAILFSILMITCDTLDNIFYTLSSKWFGKNLDLLSQFDMKFRKIAGRRNIYSFMFMIGFSLGYYIETFIATSIWSFITATVHFIRLIQEIRKRR